MTAQAPTPGVAARAALEQTTITVKVDDVSYVMRPSEISALDSSELRRASGMSVRLILAAASDDPDLDVIASIVWLARRQAGETGVSFKDVAASISYNSDLDLSDAEPDDGDDHPEV